MIVCIQCSRVLDGDSPGGGCSHCQPAPAPRREPSAFEQRLLLAARRAGRFGRPLELTLEEAGRLAKRGLA